MLCAVLSSCPRAESGGEFPRHRALHRGNLLGWACRSGGKAASRLRGLGHVCLIDRSASSSCQGLTTGASSVSGLEPVVWPPVGSSVFAFRTYKEGCGKITAKAWTSCVDTSVGVGGVDFPVQTQTCMHRGLPLFSASHQGLNGSGV